MGRGLAPGPPSSQYDGSHVFPVCRWAPQLQQGWLGWLGPPHCPGSSCPPAFAPEDNRGKQPNLISSPTGSFYSSFHGNSYFNVSKEGGARFFKKMIVEKLSWACVSCNGGFHGNSSQRQTKMRRRWVSPNHGNCSQGQAASTTAPGPKGMPATPPQGCRGIPKGH